MADLHSAAKLLVLTGIKKLASDASVGSMKRIRGTKTGEDGGRVAETPEEEAAEANVDEANLPSGPSTDESPDVEDMGDEELNELEAGEDDDIEKKKSLLKKL